MKEERGYLYVINKTHGRFFKYFKIYVYFKIYYETSFPLSKITEWNMIIYHQRIPQWQGSIILAHNYYSQ